MAASEPVALPVLQNRHPDAPQQWDLDKCVHCGLCLNACPTYRELGVEMDSPRGRVYQMVKVATGEAPMDAPYLEHLGLCLACRACETACPSGVPYGTLIEAARAEIQAKAPKSWKAELLQGFVFGHLLSSRPLLQLTGGSLWAYQNLGIQKAARSLGLLRLFGLDRIEALTPQAELPSFFRQYGRVFPAEGTRRAKVALLGGCMQNVFFARLNEATVRVLQRNGCDVHIPEDQTCCGALHAHQGIREKARELARKNIDVFVDAGFDAIISNTGGCGSTLKEYDHLLHDDPAYAERAKQFVKLMRDVNEWIAELGLVPPKGEFPHVVTYQDSCHLAHGQKVRKPPRELLRAVPGLMLEEMPMSDLCCGSAGVYNVVQNEMAMQILETKMGYANSTRSTVIVTSNPGCYLQLRAGVERHGRGQRVLHVIEVLDEAYRAEGRS
ncbi:MAG: (Fe-S)-binding protein [Bryobacter sp.]|nr:(Fe-S)-binding protein [Bryobacter sp.]